MALLRNGRVLVFGGEEALALPRLRAGTIDLEHAQAGGELRSTLGEGVQSRYGVPGCAGRVLLGAPRFSGKPAGRFFPE